MRPARSKPSAQYRQRRIEESRVVGSGNNDRVGFHGSYWVIGGVLFLGILLGLVLSYNSKFFIRFVQMVQSESPRFETGVPLPSIKETRSISQDDSVAIARRLAALENSILLRLSQLESSSSALPAVAEIKSIEEKLVTLDERLSELTSSDLLNVTRRFGQRIDALERRSGDTVLTKPSLLAPAEKVEQFKSSERKPDEAFSENVATRQQQSKIFMRLDTLSERTGALEDSIKKGSYGVAMLLSSNRLRRDLEAGAVSVASLQVLRDLSDKVGDSKLRKIVVRLEGLANLDILSYTQLTTDLTQLAKDNISLEHKVTEGNWFDRSLRRLQSVVSIRQVKNPIPGSLDAAIIEAKSAMTEGKPAAAIAALEDLRTTPHSKLSRWLTAARARLILETTINALDSLAIEKIDHYP